MNSQIFVDTFCNRNCGNSKIGRSLVTKRFGLYRIFTTLQTWPCIKFSICYIFNCHILREYCYLFKSSNTALLYSLEVVMLFWKGYWTILQIYFRSFSIDAFRHFETCQSSSWSRCTGRKAACKVKNINTVLVSHHLFQENIWHYFAIFFHICIWSTITTFKSKIWMYRL